MQNITFQPLTKDLANKFISDLTEIANLIPEVTYTSEDILCEKKGDRIMHAKWQHSIAMLNSDKLVGFIIAYEREAENNEQYPINTLYISEFGIKKTWQNHGLGSALLHKFIEYNKQLNFVELRGDFNYSVQTNAAKFNKHVVKLYESKGFTSRAFKQYPNRKDVILGYTP